MVVVFFLCFLAFLGAGVVAVAGFGSSPKARVAVPIINDMPNRTVINFFMKQFLLGISERQKICLTLTVSHKDMKRALRRN